MFCFFFFFPSEFMAAPTVFWPPFTLRVHEHKNASPYTPSKNWQMEEPPGEKHEEAESALQKIGEFKGCIRVAPEKTLLDINFFLFYDNNLEVGVTPGAETLSELKNAE